MTDDWSRFEYDPGVIRHGAGCVGALDEELAALEYDRALVVTGQTVGETAAVMGPIRDGLGDRLAGLFAETTPDKRLRTALDGAAAFDNYGADAVVAVGGGSSIDVARAVAVFAARDLDGAAAGREFVDTGTLDVPAEVPPLFAVPTTFAGADLSSGGGLTADPETGPVAEPLSGGLSDPALFPAATFFDPDLFATTPRSVLAGSAMNGFDKGIEALYARAAMPITDATATRGLGLFAEGLLSFAADYREGVPAAVEGLLLVQYGGSRPETTTVSVIHALGKFVARAGGLPQGVGHAIIAPATLAALFEEVDGRRALLARALGVADADDQAAAIVERVDEVRNAMGVTTRLRNVEGIERADLSDIATRAARHRFARYGPPDLAVSAEWFEEILDDAR